MTRDPQHFTEAEQKASEPTTAENYLCSHQFPAPLGRRAEQYFNHLTPEFAGAEIIFCDGSRLIYDGRWTAAPPVMTPRDLRIDLLQELIDAPCGGDDYRHWMHELLDEFEADAEEKEC